MKLERVDLSDIEGEIEVYDRETDKTYYQSYWCIKYDERPRTR